MKKKIAVLYATKEGQTLKIARVISEEIRKLGHSAELIDVGNPRASVDPTGWDAAIVGAPVHISRYPRAFRKRIRALAPELNRVPSWFFSVCLGVLEKDNEKTQAAEREIVSRFLEETGFRPSRTSILAGAIRYSAYGWLKRRALRSIARKAGVETTFDRDWEFTDWKAVRRLSLDLLALPEAR